MIQINPLQSYIDGGARAAITSPPSASLVFDLPGKAIWVKGVKLKGIDHTYTFSHDNYITLTNTPGSDESEDILIGVNITLLKQAIDTTYTTGTLVQLTTGTDTTALVWTAKILSQYVAGVLPTTKKMKINGTDYSIYTTESSLPTFLAPTTLGTAGQILACTASGLTWVNQIQNTDYKVTQSSSSLNEDYRVILKLAANNDPETTFVRFSEYLTFNPSTKLLKINGLRVITLADIYVGATSSADATTGLVPAATSSERDNYLRGDGTWLNISSIVSNYTTWRPIKVAGTERLGSGTDTGAIDFVAGTGITLGWDATNKKITITNSAPDQNHNTDRTGIKKDTVSGTKKTDTTLIVANTSSGLIFEGGTNLFKIGDGTNYVEIPVTPSFTVTDKSASILSSLTTLATIAGTDIKAKVVVEDKAATLTTTAQTIATIAGVDITAKITNYNTDENVKQVPKTDNVNRPLMMINGGTSAGNLTSTSMFSTGIYANASSKMITANGFIKNGFDDAYVLLAGGGAKLLSDFLLSLPAHDHERILPTRHDDNDPNPSTKGTALTFQFSYINSEWWNVLNMRSYGDYRYNSAQLLTPAGNPGSDSQYGDMYWREGRNTTWFTFRKILDNNNSSVSGGGSTLGSSITVNLGGSSKTLTIPNSISWSQLTGIPSSFNPSAHDHDGRYVRVYNNHTTNPNIDSLNTEFYLLGTDSLYGAGTKPANSDNAVGILNVCTHGAFYSQLALETTINRLYMRSAVAGAAFGSWAKVAYISDIPSTYAWTSITSKPDTATRWPTWDEVTNKPSTFPPSEHDHYRILPTRHDSNAPSPKDKGASLTFQFSYFESNWWNVLNMRSYGDYNYSSTLLLTKANNPGSDTYSGDSMYWRQGRNSTWNLIKCLLDSSNYTSYTYSISLSDARFVRSFHNASTNPSIDTFTDTAYFLTLADSGSWAGGAQPSGSHNGLGIINMHTHTGSYYTLLALDTNLNRLWIRSANNSSSWTGWARLAMASEIPTNTWRPITNTYTGSDQSTSVSQYGTNALYNALLNGYANEAGSATRCRYVTCPDTRNTMPAPGDYTASTTGISFDFKYNGVSGLSGAYYAGIMTVRPYAGGQDWSGGPAHQLAFNGDGRLLHRTGTSSWGSWVVVPQCDTSGNLTCTNFYTTSDRSKKQNISSFSEHIRKFQLKDTEKWHYGVIALEVPKLFVDGEEGNMTVNYNSMLSYYIGLLENRVAQLESELKALKEKLGVQAAELPNR